MYKCFFCLISCSRKDVKDDLNDLNEMTKFHIEVEDHIYMYIFIKEF